MTPRTPDLPAHEDNVARNDGSTIEGQARIGRQLVAWTSLASGLCALAMILAKDGQTAAFWQGAHFALLAVVCALILAFRIGIDPKA